MEHFSKFQYEIVQSKLYLYGNSNLEALKEDKQTFMQNIEQQVIM